MLNEEGLLLLLILGACAVSVLGTLELVWPTRPRHARRRSAAGIDARRLARPRPVPVAPARPDPEPPPIAAALPSVAPAPVTVEPLADAATAVPAPMEVVALTAAEPVAEGAPSGETLAERGLALVGAGRFAEALTVGREGLAAMKSADTSAPTTESAGETARLWGLVGLAQQGLGETEDARFAFEEAIAQAPGSERQTWERHLAALALEVGRRPLAAPDTAPSAARIASLEAAIEWLDRGLAVAPDDAQLGETRTRAHEALWATHETAIADLVRDKAFVEARHRLGAAMTDPECPPERRGALAGLLARTLGGQARQATADALRHRLGGREGDAVAALARAEDLLTPLFRAWSIAGDDERSRQTRTLLVEALEEIVDGRAEDIERMIDGGDAGLALIHAEKLWSLVRGAMDQGLAREDLAVASARALALFDRLGAGHPAAERS
jgi:tetratricopeptide (TPR) repeat protein